MKTINVLGCCCSRDLITPEDISSQIYSVPKCVTIMSPLSQYLVKGGRRLESSDFSKFRNEPGFNYLSRISALDNNNEIFEHIGSVKSDYLLLDIVDIRLPVARYSFDSYLTFTNFIRGNQPAFEQLVGNKISLIDFDSVTYKQWEDCVKWYLDKVLKIYRPDQIIFNELLMVDNLLDINEQFVFFDRGRVCLNGRINVVLRKLYSFCRRYVPGALFMPFPRCVYAVWNHIWGPYPLHFANEYYQYGREALKTATSDSLTVNEKQKEINRLEEVCSCQFTKLRAELNNLYLNTDRNQDEAGKGEAPNINIPVSGKNFINNNQEKKQGFLANIKFWEQHLIKNYSTLFPLKNYDNGSDYALYELPEDIEKDHRYSFELRFKMFSDTATVNIFLYDPASNRSQIIYTFINEPRTIRKWCNVRTEILAKFSCPGNIAVSSSEITGDSSYFMLAKARCHTVKS